MPGLHKALTLCTTFMDTFYKLNREKIRFAFVTASLTLIGFVFLILAIAYYAKSLPDKNLLIAIFLTAGFGLPVFIVLLSYLKWLFRQKARHKAFSLEPFNQLENIGFVDTLLNIDTKWHFTEKRKCLHVDGYTLKAEISEEFSETLELEIPIEWKKLNKPSFNKLTDKFSKHDIDFGIGCLKKRYKINGQTFQNINELKLDIDTCISLIKDEGFKPSKKGCA